MFLGRISGIELDLADGVIAKVAVQMWVDSGDKNTGVSQTAKDEFVITVGAHHNNFSIALRADVIVKFV